jgi:DHA1 family multidrug resistance protein-like MFS transporter
MRATGDTATADGAQTGDYTRITLAIAAAVGTANLSYNFWAPFLPLFMLEVGARDEANALFWIAVATTVQGVGRLVSGPIWGVLADRFGRKDMLLRCLIFATISNLVTASIGAPWHLIFSFVLQGIFSGYVPASAALISVSVPDSRLSRSLSMVTSAQYLGNTLGPMLGALMVIVFDYRATIVIASLFPLVSTVGVWLLVPRDRPGATGAAAAGGSGRGAKLEPFHPTFQLGLAILVYFVIFTMVQAIRLLSPLAIKDIDPGNVDGTIGLTFTLGGLASAVSLLFLAPLFFRSGRLQRALVASSFLSGLAMLSLAAAGNIPLYILGFALFSLVQAAMIPASNTLIAGNAPRSRRGTAFGVASSAQALSFMIGPFSAALFAAVSLDLGFVVLAGVLFALAPVVFLFLREPALTDRSPAS